MKSMIPLKINWQGLSNLNFSALLFQAARYRTGVVLTVITILMYQSVGIFYKAVSLELIGTNVSAPIRQKALMTTAAAPEPIESYKVVSERNLFGTTDKILAAKLSSAGKGTATQTDITATLEVRGTVAGDAKYGFAVIEDKTLKQQKLYKVGDFIAGAKVIRIRRNSVVLMVDHQERILRIPETSERPILPARTAGPGGLPAGAAGGGPMTIDKNDLAANLKDMGSMLSQAQIRPYFSGGVPDGFMISNIKSGSIYQKIGLTEGDIIQSVNNRKMTSGDDMVELFNNLKSASGLSLTIRRQGRQENYNYIFK